MRSDYLNHQIANGEAVTSCMAFWSNIVANGAIEKLHSQLGSLSPMKRSVLTLSYVAEVPDHLTRVGRSFSVPFAIIVASLRLGVRDSSHCLDCRKFLHLVPYGILLGPHAHLYLTL